MEDYSFNNLKNGEKKSYSINYNIYRDMFFILVLINIIYIGIFVYLYIKGVIILY